MRRSFSILAGASLVLCVLILVNWAYSYRTFHRFFYGPSDGVALYEWGTLPGAFFVKVNWSSNPVPHWPGHLHLAFPASRSHEFEVVYVDFRWRLLGFFVHWRHDPDDSFGGRGLQVPFWFLAAVTAIVPFLWLRRFRRQRRRRRLGLCLVCGYDLRASTHCQYPLQENS